MPKRSRKPPPSGDANETAFYVVRQATGKDVPPARKKNPAAVALGKLGGQKGGPARAAKLSSKRRREIAQEAARARWGNDKT